VVEEIMTREDAFELLKKIGPQVELPSAFLYPPAQRLKMAKLSAIDVFDAIRESCDPSITTDEFNAFMDEMEATDAA
jgi:hypothetical protein